MSTKNLLHFRITADVLRIFVLLTNDKSSLHEDSLFARQSMYRKNIVHGMLPITFLAALTIFSPEKKSVFLTKLSSKFIKPIHLGDNLNMSVMQIGLDEQLKQTMYQYKIYRSEIIVTQGHFTLQDVDALASNTSTPSGRPKLAVSGLINEKLQEECLVYDQISKGQQATLPFCITKDHTHAFHQMLLKGLTQNNVSKAINRLYRGQHNNLLATCLFSTLVGMRLPGKYATFIDFSTTFNTLIKNDCNYELCGKVTFKSDSTHTLVEETYIMAQNNPNDTCSSGKLNVKVNEPPSLMPSIKSLKNDHLNLGLKNKIVLITGSSRGIGETTAKLFSLHGSKVVVHYNQGQNDANNIVNEIESSGGSAFAVQADITHKDQVQRMISLIADHYGPVDILVNNAVRNFEPIHFLELDWDEFQKDIDVIIKGAFHCCQAVLPSMLQKKSGKIINIATLATENPPSKQAKYVASKSALIGLSRSLAVEYAAHNIQVNTVLPSYVQTDLTKHISPLDQENLRQQTPMQRNAIPADVAKAVIFLASSLSSFTTGQKIMVTGGNMPLL